MSGSTATRPARGEARRRLLDAAVDVIRVQGLSATTVDDLCRAAGVTKGAFFHHFESKDALAVAVADHWSRTTGELFATAAYHELDDPADRVLGYLDLRARLVDGPIHEFTCLVGTMVQEAYSTQPTVREACAASIFGHAATVEADLSAALAAAGSDLDPVGLSRHIQAVLQGSFILSKAADDPQVARDSIAHLRRYVEGLVHSQPTGA